MSGLISFPGLSSDQDFNSIIDALVSARRSARVTPLENWKAEWEAKIEAVGEIDSALATLFNTVRGMDRESEFLVRTAHSSDETVAEATASSTAIPGVHTLEINQLAKAETEVHQGIQNTMMYHDGVGDQTDPVNSSGSDKTFKYAYGGTTRTITVADGESLQDLRDAINADPGNPGVTAKIVTAGGEDHLVLVETTPDPAKLIQIDPNDDMTLDGSDSTVDLTGDTFSQTINASGSDKVFAFQYDSEAAVEITVQTGTTLSGLRDLINAADAGVRASILNDGGSGSGAQHLVLSGEETGSDYTITLNPGSATTLDGTSDTEDFTGGV